MKADPAGRAETGSAPAEANGPAPLRFDLRELSGSLGDLGTFLPLALALAVGCGLDLGRVFIAAGVMHALSGWWFRQPVPVQPMKAIAAVAIAEGLGAEAVFAAGLGMGALLVLLAASGGVDAVARWVPHPVVRGIQAGVGAKLALVGVAWTTGLGFGGSAFEAATPLPWVGPDSLLVAAIAAALLVGARSRRMPMLLLVFAAGLMLTAVAHPEAVSGLELQPPGGPRGLPGSAEAWRTGLWRGTLPQLPLTLLNSVVAVCALSADYFPGRGMAPRRVAASVGLMNLAAVPFGGMPMCHGSGGLAAQVRFGARTGGSVVLLGLAKIAVGLLFGAGLAGLVEAYPRSILAVMLVLAGLTLARAARDALARPVVVVTSGTALFVVAANTAVGALVGLALAGGLELRRRVRGV